MRTAFIVCGTPGAGKSTYALQLAFVKRAALLDIDTVTERLIRVALASAGSNPNDRDSRHFKRTFREPIYQTLFDIARDNLPIQNVIVVGPFTKEIQDPAWPSALARTLGGKVEVHYVTCPKEIRKARLAKRGETRDLEKLRHWESYVRYYGQESPPVFEHVLVDGLNLNMESHHHD